MKRTIAAVVSIALLAALASLVDWSALGSTFLAARPAPLAAGCLIVLAFPFLNAARWQAVLDAVGISMSHRRCLEVTLAVWPVGTLTPAKAGEALKAVAVQPAAPLAQGIGSALAERVVDVGVLGTIGLGFGIHSGSTLPALVGGAALGASLAVLLAGRPLSRIVTGYLPARPARTLENLLSVLPALLARPGCLARCAAVSAVNWMASVVQLWLLLVAFGTEAPFARLAAALPTATFAGLLPLTIAGAGTRDAALLLLLGDTAAAPALLAASTIYTLTGYFLLGAIGLPFLWRLRGATPADDPSARKVSPT